jgi:predicted acylesterase/phospholipase RssA
VVQGDPQATRAIRRGLVLPGGAALGAFQAGALKAIREAGIEFHIIAATSIGLVHALAWNRGEEFVARLDGRWRKDAAEFAPFDPKRLLRLKNPFSFGKSLDKLFSQYRSTQPNVGDKGTIPILISLTEAATGRNVAFSVSEPGLSAAVRTDAYRAATTIPVLGDAPIEIRGKRYYDGGFSNNVPIDYFADADLDEIWIVDPIPSLPARVWHAPLWRVAKALRSATKNPWFLGAAGVALQYFGPREKTVPGKKLVTIQLELKGSFRYAALAGALTFAPKQIDLLLSLGYRQARRTCRDYLENQATAPSRTAAPAAAIA